MYLNNIYESLGENKKGRERKIEREADCVCIYVGA